MNNNDNFLKAIEEKMLIEFTFKSQEKGIITRKCVPFDLGPSKKADAIDKSPKYHMFDLDSPEGRHNLAVDPAEMISIKITQEAFDPADYVKWPAPYSWFVPRNWGQFS